MVDCNVCEKFEMNLAWKKLDKEYQRKVDDDEKVRL